MQILGKITRDTSQELKQNQSQIEQNFGKTLLELEAQQLAQTQQEPRSFPLKARHRSDRSNPENSVLTKTLRTRAIETQTAPNLNNNYL
jgi:hypothetical protein